jgi:hypothetical protein
MTADELNSFIDEEERHVHKFNQIEKSWGTSKNPITKSKNRDNDMLQFEVKLAAMRRVEALKNAVAIATQAARLADAKAMSASVDAKRVLQSSRMQMQVNQLSKQQSRVIKISPPPPLQPAQKPPTPCYYGKGGKKFATLFDHSCSSFG